MHEGAHKHRCLSTAYEVSDPQGTWKNSGRPLDFGQERDTFFC